MAILYGTQSNGETLPVLVDQFGNLLAKGIDGEPGTPGAPGEPGEPGAPGAPGGAFPLPPDPYEGAILGWDDGELAWIGGSVPLPEGTYGPYVYDLESGSLDIPQDASDLVNGQQLYMSDINGEATLVKFATDTIASVVGHYLTSDLTLTFPTANNFDKFEVGDVVQGTFKSNTYKVYSAPLQSGQTPTSDPTAYGIANVMTFVEEVPNGSAPTSTDLTINYIVDYQTIATDVPFVRYIGSYSGNTYRLYSSMDALSWTKVNEVTTIPAPGGLTFTSGSTPARYLLMTQEYNGNLTDSGLESYGIDTDSPVRVTAIDATVPSITVDGGSWFGADGSGNPNGETALDSKSFSGAGSVSYGLENRIILRNNNKEWVDDFYVTAPEQRIAARKVATTAIRKKKK